MPPKPRDTPAFTSQQLAGMGLAHLPNTTASAQTRALGPERSDLSELRAPDSIREGPPGRGKITRRVESRGPSPNQISNRRKKVRKGKRRKSQKETAESRIFGKLAEKFEPLSEGTFDAQGRPLAPIQGLAQFEVRDFAQATAGAVGGFIPRGSIPDQVLKLLDQFQGNPVKGIDTAKLGPEESNLLRRILNANPTVTRSAKATKAQERKAQRIVRGSP